MMLQLPPRDVLEQAACAGTDPEAFYPPQGESLDYALAVCRECPVMQSCRTWALDTKQKHGVWGGLTVTMRRRIWGWKP